MSENLAVKNENMELIIDAKTEETYRSIRGHVVEAQHEVYRAVNNAMVLAYWKIGKEIYEACGENDRATYTLWNFRKTDG